MSLLDDARARHTVVVPCKLASQIMAKFPEDKWGEAGELLLAEDVTHIDKMAVLAIDYSPKSWGDKVRRGCLCDWCQKYWVAVDA